jgi:hypothetical protein
MAQQCYRTVVRWRLGMFPSAVEEVAEVETPSLRCFKPVRGRETRLSHLMNLALCWIYDAEWVQRVGVRCEHLDSWQLEAIQDSEI